jgi:hypothetical protein
MRVLVLTPYRYGETPGPRSSIELWEKVLAPQGVHFDYQPFETDRLAGLIYEPGRYGAKAVAMLDAYARRLRNLGSIDDADAVLVYREAALIGPALIERLAARRKPLIYQLDDPLYVPYRSPSNGWLSYLKMFGKVGRICRMSAVTIVNSPQHRRYAESQGARRIFEIPSVVDADLYFRRERPRGEPLRVGWTGSASTVANLALIEAPLREAVRRTGAEVTVVGTARAPLEGIDVRAVPWSAATEVDEVSGFDIGLLPVPRTPWNERKFFLKLVQYMTLGVPAVATPIGATPEVIDDGVTGLLAGSDAEWVAAIERLAGDEGLRRSIGERAAAVGAERYTVQANAERILAAFEAAL